MSDKPFVFEDFDREWTHLGREICQTIYTNPRMQELKTALQKNGYLTMEEKSDFIDLCNGIKYQVIYKKFGDEHSEGFKLFSGDWQKWFQAKGVESEQLRGQKSSVDHILFGSTPDPVPFLLHFEEEMLGSMKKASE